MEAYNSSVYMQSSSIKQIGFTHGHRSPCWELCTKEMCFLGVLTWRQVNQHVHNIGTLVLDLLD
jgi:hypothetical protein